MKESDKQNNDDNNDQHNGDIVVAV